MDESLLITDNPYILVKKAYIFWSYENSFGEKNNPTVTIDNGYYTFSDIKKLIEEESNGGVTITLNRSTARAACDNSNVTTLLISPCHHY